MMIADVPPHAHGEPRLATDARSAFTWRVLAAIVDVLVLSLLSGAVNFVFGVTRVTSGSPVPPPGGGGTWYTTVTDVAWLPLIWLVYFVTLEALFGATVGKWLFRLRVTGLDGRLPGFWPVVVRTIARVVDGLPIGYLVGGSIALLSPARQRLGDHLAHTLVVPAEALAAPLLTPTQARRRGTVVAAALVVCLAFSATFFYFGRPPLVIQSLIATRDMMFRDGVSTYTLSAPTWGAGTVTYQITYMTEQPVDSCHARLTLAWTFPTGWQPRYGHASCATHTP